MYFIFQVLVALAQLPVFTCDPALADRFAPQQPQLGHYEVCTTAAHLEDVVDPDWRVEQLLPLDAFGGGGRYDRHALARLYGGRRVTVARGWIQRGNELESITAISPYPDPSLARLVQGTLMIRFIICCL